MNVPVSHLTLYGFSPTLRLSFEPFLTYFMILVVIIGIIGILLPRCGLYIWKEAAAIRGRRIDRCPGGGRVRTCGVYVGTFQRHPLDHRLCSLCLPRAFSFLFYEGVVAEYSSSWDHLYRLLHRIDWSLMISLEELLKPNLGWLTKHASLCTSPSVEEGCTGYPG